MTVSDLICVLKKIIFRIVLYIIIKILFWKAEIAELDGNKKEENSIPVFSENVNNGWCFKWNK